MGGLTSSSGGKRNPVTLTVIKEKLGPTPRREWNQHHAKARSIERDNSSIAQSRSDLTITKPLFRIWSVTLCLSRLILGMHCLSREGSNRYRHRKTSCTIGACPTLLDSLLAGFEKHLDKVPHVEIGVVQRSWRNSYHVWLPLVHNYTVLFQTVQHAI
jgi:hypothetical protein